MSECTPVHAFSMSLCFNRNAEPLQFLELNAFLKIDRTEVYMKYFHLSERDRIRMGFCLTDTFLLSHLLYKPFNGIYC